MILLRVLVFVVFALMVLYWLRRKRSTRNDQVPNVEKLAQCVHCKVRFPASEAIADGQNVYCCEAHRTAAADAE